MPLQVTNINKKTSKSRDAIARHLKMKMNNQVILNLVAKMRTHQLNKKYNLKRIETVEISVKYRKK